MIVYDMATLEDLTLRVRAGRRLPEPAVRRAIRQAARVSLADVAAVVGVTRQAVSLWELGQRTPRGPMLNTYVSTLRALQRATIDEDENAGGSTLAPDMREPDSSPGPSSRDTYREQSYHPPHSATTV